MSSVLLGISFQGYAQGSGKVVGNAMEKYMNPLTFMVVTLVEIKQSTVANGNGKFSFNGIKQGEYIIEVSHLGYESHQERIAFGTAHTCNVKYICKPSAKYARGSKDDKFFVSRKNFNYSLIKT